MCGFMISDPRRLNPVKSDSQWALDAETEKPLALNLRLSNGAEVYIGQVYTGDTDLGAHLIGLL